jgi:hypothetical protein
MSSISVLQAPGSGQAVPAKSEQTASPQTPQSEPVISAASATSASIYPSPRIEIDPQLNTVIIQYLNTADGLANYQVPSKAHLLLYQQHQHAHDTQGVKAADGRPGNIDGKS